MGEEIKALGQIPTGMDQAQQLSSFYANWLGPQIGKIRYGQEPDQRIVRGVLEYSSRLSQGG
eukprot:1970160-Karenia_brevis.AAC.1